MFVRRFEIVVVDGPQRGQRAVAEEDELTVGTAIGAGLRLSDGAVSRLHCVVRVGARGIELRDLGSTNGTFVGEVEVARAYIRSGTRVRLGATTIAVTVLDDEIEQPLAAEDRCGELLGASPAMRRLYPLIEQCAARDATVLVHGETGTGKELVAEAIHARSARRSRPLVVVDCSALARQLAESELFGHVRGAFSGADADRDGAFAEADGGTIFLDEIGELPLELQPLLLRAIENRTVRRVGTTEQRAVDVRIIAASHRDLRVEVNAKRFRADLYYRLNVLHLTVPPLRERDGDVELLARHFWRRFRPAEDIPPALLAGLLAQSWPGNVRELRNAVERSAAVGWTPPPAAELSYGQARERAVQQFEHAWVAQLMAAHGDNLSKAARAAQMGRAHLRTLCQRYGLRSKLDDES
ncbi:MAG: sigma 54-dependent Fis family transcriptional regulator [Deltaproteobacteria bacterium]|nr:sigma 54-dependent Fis family transcriptional regulator [Deltaproteobacteria bacterium]